ncbi:hypothetical protein [Pseudohalocynthiibacter sp. F2068]|jgi:hypothetical protein|uniref:hypothetical protein n=1 Tax=Pseudohalocynthiibacter sp. F2068 TaxID=2926418 RepID=UPI001FF5CE7E|nr:hypothetical protein [Pseudohalocynthiibacter sp. F2068]MCK0101875.1 hypothetical protein [Pseudohalocynthiibacter sp. F2068]
MTTLTQTFSNWRVALASLIVGLTAYPVIASEHLDQAIAHCLDISLEKRTVVEQLLSDGWEQASDDGVSAVSIFEADYSAINLVESGQLSDVSAQERHEEAVRYREKIERSTKRTLLRSIQSDPVEVRVTALVHKAGAFAIISELGRMIQCRLFLDHPAPLPTDLTGRSSLPELRLSDQSSKHTRGEGATFTEIVSIIPDSEAFSELMGFDPSFNLFLEVRRR